MFSLYRQVLKVPGAGAITIAGFVMRMSNPMIGLSIVLLISARTGSYALAGAVSATFGLTNVPTNPMLGRLVDRFGQIRVAVPTAAIHGAGIIGLIAVTYLRWPHWLLFVFAVVMSIGFLPTAPMVRARWSALFSDNDRLARAYSLDQALTEITYVLGPITATFLATQVAPPAALLGALFLVCAGLVALTFQRSTEPVLVKAEHRSRNAIFLIPGLILLFIVFVGLGGIFASTEVAVVAFVDANGQRDAAAWILALFATGSALAGIVYGTRRWTSDVRPRLVSLSLVLACGVCATLLAQNAIQIACVLLIAGIGIAPSLVEFFRLVTHLAPAGSLTEAMAFASAGSPLGGAIGSGMAGRLADTYGAHAAFIIPASSSLIVFLTVALGARWLVTPQPDVITGEDIGGTSITVGAVSE